MRRLYARWRRWSAAERRLLFEAWRWLLEVRLALWVMPFRSAHQRYDVERVAARRGGRILAAAEPEAVATAIRRARRLVPAGTCLPQAMAARALLARRGIGSDLRIGVGKDARGRLQAHAWVEIEGRIIIGELPDMARYRRLPDLPSDVP